MCNKTVNDTSYSSNKNDLYKTSIKEITNHPKESTILNVLGIIFTVLLSTSTILIIFTHNFELSTCGAFSLILLLVSAFIINLFFKDRYIRGFTISLSAYICSIAYMDVLNDTIQHIHIIEDFIAILAVTIYFAITCSFIYRSFQLVLKENTKYIIPISFLPIILGTIFSSRGIFNNYISYFTTVLTGLFTVLVSFENLSVLARKIFKLNIKDTEENKYKLIKVKVLILLSQVLIVLSMVCLNSLYKNYYDGKNKNFLKYVDIHSYTGNGLFLIIIFLIFYSITYLIFFMCKKSIKKFIEKYLDYEKSIKHEVHTYRNHRYICKFKKSKNVK
ncbi:hypothetical protein AXE75_03860 [Gardnerella vaginalis]|uniref:hypothetical protein n=1 Tax=Gardnerella vaginalis TaxID=2702 RepID=UPI000E312173|nr:hypothetical protein [Gardnerella vaginalis]RFD76443.1 hypothetical protein AXE75_03860 [Gardnerella vaginalis]